MQKFCLPGSLYPKKVSAVQASLEDALRLANESPSHIVQSLLKLLPLCKEPGSVSPHVSPSKGVTQIPTLPWVPWIYVCCFSKLDFLGPCFSGPKSGVPIVGHKPLIPSREALHAGEPSSLCVTARG